jgi:hypothetical protein
VPEGDPNCPFGGVLLFVADALFLPGVAMS